MLQVDIINKWVSGYKSWVSERQTRKKGIFITRETIIRKFRCFKPPVNPVFGGKFKKPTGTHQEISYK